MAFMLSDLKQSFLLIWSHENVCTHGLQLCNVPVHAIIVAGSLLRFTISHGLPTLIKYCVDTSNNQYVRGHRQSPFPPSSCTPFIL